MNWQDIVFMIGGFLLGGSLIPTVLSKQKPHIYTCALQSVILVVFTYAYFTMGFWWAFAGIGFNALMWLIILVQKWGSNG